METYFYITAFVAGFIGFIFGHVNAKRIKEK